MTRSNTRLSCVVCKGSCCGELGRKNGVGYPETKILVVCGHGTTQYVLSRDTAHAYNSSNVWSLILKKSLCKGHCLKIRIFFTTMEHGMRCEHRRNPPTAKMDRKQIDSTAYTALPEKKSKEKATGKSIGSLSWPVLGFTVVPSGIKLFPDSDQNQTVPNGRRVL